MAYLIADLKAIPTVPSPVFKNVMVLGSTAIDDGGGGIYHWNGASTDTGDDAEWVVPTDNPTTGRWQRISRNVEAASANLTALAGLTSAADTLPYFTGSGTASTTPFTAFGRSLVDDVAAVNGRSTLGLGTIATQASDNVTITGGSITGVTGGGGLAEATVTEYRTGTAAVAISPAVMESGSAPVTLTDAATVAIDFNAGRVFDLTLGGNRAMGQPSNQTAGQSGEFWIYQDGTAGRTLTWHADFKFAGGPPTIPSAIGGFCVVAYRVRAANDIRCATNADVTKLLTVTETGTSRTNTVADNGNWVRWTSTTTKSFTIENSIAAPGDLWQGINAATSGTLTLIAGSGVTLTGTLTFAFGKTYSIRFATTSAADVIGGA